MRTLIIVAISFLLVSFTMASPNDRTLNGIWYNPSTDQAIRIKENHRSLNIKWLDDRMGNSRFERVDRGVFIDDYGNRIIVDHSDVIVFIPRKRHRHQKWVFEKISESKYNDHVRQGHCRGNNYDDYQYKSKSHYNQDRYESNYGDKNDRWKNDVWDNNRYEQAVTGTWKVDRDGRLIAIVDTREGLKAKFSGSSQWVSYVQTSNNAYAFRDEQGNEYRFTSNGKAQWISSKNGDRVIDLTKISDEVKY